MNNVSDRQNFGLRTHFALAFFFYALPLMHNSLATRNPHLFLAGPQLESQIDEGQSSKMLRSLEVESYAIHFIFNFVSETDAKCQ